MPRGDMDDVFCYTKIGFMSVLCFIRKNVTGIIFMNHADPDTACKQKRRESTMSKESAIQFLRSPAADQDGKSPVKAQHE